MKKLLLLIGVILLFCSCEQEQASLLPGDVSATFIPTIEEIEAASTRVDNNQWSGNEIVGIMAYASGSAYSSKYHQYTPSSSGTRTQLLPADGEDPIYFPIDNSALTFAAFAPYVVPVSNKVTYTLTNQNSATTNVLESLDFIYHKGTKAYSQSNPVVALTFEHKLSRVVVNLSRGSTYTNSLAASVIGMQNVYGAVECNLTDGSIVASTPTATITPYRLSSTETTASFQAIVAPQTGATTRKLVLTVNGQSYLHDIPQDYEAGMSYTYDFELTATGLVLAGSTVISWGAGTVVWDTTGKAITTDKNTLNFAPSASTQTVTIKVKGTTTVPIASYSTSAESITGTPDCISSSLPITTGTTTGGWTTYTLSVTSTANSESTNREAFVHVQVDELSAVVTVTQLSMSTITLADGNTNCFIVAPGTTIHFPVTRAITIGGADASDTFDAVKLWDDTSGGAVAFYTVSGTGSDAVISVTAGSNPGNALIAAQVSGTTYWSWHIWVTDYNPWQGATFTNTWNTNNNGSHFVFMDRNLGATFAGIGNLANNDNYGTGLFYQWGRKDPFPATGTAATNTAVGGGTWYQVETSATLGTIENTIRNPHTRYLGVDESSYDWYYGGGSGYANRNNELWGHSGGKTVYDPCPIGWRVPKNSATSTATSPWYGFSEDIIGTPANIVGEFSKGYSWGTNAQFPAAGSRSRSGTSLSSVGSGGRYWGASPVNNLSYSGSCLYFDSSSVYLNGSANPLNQARAYAFSVRCTRI